MFVNTALINLFHAMTIMVFFVGDWKMVMKMLFLFRYILKFNTEDRSNASIQENKKLFVTKRHIIFFLTCDKTLFVLIFRLRAECVFFPHRSISTSKVTILGYGLLTTDARLLVEALCRQQFAVVVVDESHYLKSRNAARTKILVPLIQSANRAILLTGTPALGRPEEVIKSSEMKS